RRREAPGASPACAGYGITEGEGEKSRGASTATLSVLGAGVMQREAPGRVRCRAEAPFRGTGRNPRQATAGPALMWEWASDTHLPQATATWE
ncbi:hypothetical protein, partial [uncultured Bilophila sp.]|uniref:hypothetical protein n=1 Tax=uncultured Bilophila sp. TaxID=529385 RepID=UPI00260A94D0